MTHPNNALSNGSDNENLPWYDYKPGRGGTIPNNVTHLRVGFLEYEMLLAGYPGDQLEILQRACYGIESLKQVQIYLPTVSRIGMGAFCRCKGLEQVEFLMKPPSNPGKQEKEAERSMLPSQLVSIGYMSFYNCCRMHSLIGLEHAKESLKLIGPQAFSSCGSLVNVDLKLNKLCLGTQAFSHCSTLTNVDLSTAVHIINLQDGTFLGCESLVSVHLPPALLRIGYEAFRDCTALEAIYVPQNVQIIGEKAFSKCQAIKFIVLPSSLKRISWHCFHDCDKLSAIFLPSPKIPFLKKHPFNKFCHSLSSLVLPSQVACQHWPLILEQFCGENGILRLNGRIENPKNCNTIVWNFLCQNIAQLFVREPTSLGLSKDEASPQALSFCWQQ